MQIILNTLIHFLLLPTNPSNHKLRFSYIVKLDRNFTKSVQINKECDIFLCHFFYNDIRLFSCFHQILSLKILVLFELKIIDGYLIGKLDGV